MSLWQLLHRADTFHANPVPQTGAIPIVAMLIESFVPFAADIIIGLALILISFSIVLQERHLLSPAHDPHTHSFQF